MKLPKTLKQIPGDVLLQHIRPFMSFHITDQQIIDRARQRLAEAAIRSSLARMKAACAPDNPDPFWPRHKQVDKELSLQDRLWPIAYPNSDYQPNATADLPAAAGKVRRDVGATCSDCLDWRMDHGGYCMSDPAHVHKSTHGACSQIRRPNS